MHILRLALVSGCVLSLSACGGAPEAGSADASAQAGPEQAAGATPNSPHIPAYQRTGTIELVQVGGRQTFYTTFNTVPGQAGREIHTASWTRMADIGLPGPDDIFMSLSARPTVEPEPGQPELKIEFSLDPETLQARQGTPVKLSLHPQGLMGGEALEAANAALLLDNATRVDERTLALSGRVTGDMQGRPFSATFAIDTARNRSAPNNR